jgi:hypothetical protein
VTGISLASDTSDSQSIIKMHTVLARGAKCSF